MLRSVVRTLAITATLAAPALASAQTRTLQLCDAANRFCGSVALTRLSDTQLQVDLRNAGVSGGLDSFISGFGLYNLGDRVTGALSTATFAGVNPATSVNLLAQNSGGQNDTWASTALPNDFNGTGTQPIFAGSDFGNDGLRPCGATFTDVTTGGARRFVTCESEYARFTITLSAALSDAQFTNVGVALRAQGLGANGQGSDKCFSTGDQDCVVTPPMGVVPEPSTYALMGTGLLGLLGVAKRRRSV